MSRDKIIEIAKELEIEMIGFTDSKPLENIREQINNRSAAGRSTSFEEKDNFKRLDPKATMKECSSIIVLGMSYNRGYNIKNTATIKGSLSKSSWGMDYHLVLMDKMNALTEKMGRYFKFKHMSFCDTGPLVDRELAFKAGLGYYGKNCSIINPDYGSFFFIGYILTDLEIKANEILLGNQCGNCTLCLDVCPTGALEDAGNLNPHNCISYLTQSKDLISEGLSSKMGINVYGCDTCQNVCPQNKNIIKSVHKEFDPIKTGGIIDIEELFHMSKRQFNEKYGDMSGSWRGKTILIRNSLIVLENMESERYAELIKLVEKKDTELLKPYISRIL